MVQNPALAGWPREHFLADSEHPPRDENLRFSTAKILPAYIRNDSLLLSLRPESLRFRGHTPIPGLDCCRTAGGIAPVHGEDGLPTVSVFRFRQKWNRRSEQRATTRRRSQARESLSSGGFPIPPRAIFVREVFLLQSAFPEEYFEL